MDYTKLPCYIDYTKLPCYISYRRSTTVFLETYPIVNLHDSQRHTSYARSKRLDVPQNITRWLGLDIFLRREFSQALRFCCSYTDILDLFIVTENKPEDCVWFNLQKLDSHNGKNDDDRKLPVMRNTLEWVPKSFRKIHFIEYVSQAYYEKWSLWLHLGWF